MEAELEIVRTIVNGAALPDDVRHTVAWCLDQLPRLYREFLQTYDSRHTGEILRLVQGMLQKLTGAAPAESAAIAGQLQAMHERLGLPRLDLKPAPQVKPSPRSRKTA